MIAIVQKKIYPATSGLGFTVEFDAPTTAGNFLVAAYSVTNSSLSRVPAAPSAPWIKNVESTTPAGVTGTLRSAIFVYPSAASISSVTFTGGASAIQSCVIYELSGVDESFVTLFGTRVTTSVSRETGISMGTPANQYPNGAASLYVGSCSRGGANGWIAWDVTSQVTPETEDVDQFATGGYNAGGASRIMPATQASVTCGNPLGLNNSYHISACAIVLKGAEPVAASASPIMFASD
jgi:hypothetical protein